MWLKMIKAYGKVWGVKSPQLVTLCDCLVQGWDSHFAVYALPLLLYSFSFNLSSLTEYSTPSHSYIRIHILTNTILLQVEQMLCYNLLTVLWLVLPKFWRFITSNHKSTSFMNTFES